jgi:peroxiredoxin
MNIPVSSQVSAPDFELLDTQGRAIRLSDYRGKPVVLVLLRGFI